VLAFLMAGAGGSERQARLRELRALSLVYCGRDHPATIALTAAIADPAAADRALAQLDALPTLRRPPPSCSIRSAPSHLPAS